jgi:predicted ATPase
LSDRLLDLTARQADDGFRLQAHHSAWATYLLGGEPAAAREHYEAGRGLYDPERHRSHVLLYGGHDPGVCAGYLGAQVHWLLGYPEKGLAVADESLALAKQIAHPLSHEAALLYNALLHLDRGAPELASQSLDAAEVLVAEQRLGFIVEPRFLRGAVLRARGAFEEAVACLREGLSSRLGTLYCRPYGLCQLAEALARQGAQSAALAAAREGVETQEQTGYRQWEAELHRLQGIA